MSEPTITREYLDALIKRAIVPSSFPYLTKAVKYGALLLRDALLSEPERVELRDDDGILMRYATLDSRPPHEPCQRDDHDNCTGDCSSMCCALAAAEAERDSALADLEALRGELYGWKVSHQQEQERATSLAASLAAQRSTLGEARKWLKTVVHVHPTQVPECLPDLAAILSPPEAPTDKGEL